MLAGTLVVGGFSAVQADAISPFEGISGNDFVIGGDRLNVFGQTGILPAGKTKFIDSPHVFQMPDFPTGCEIAAAVQALQFVGMNTTMATFTDKYLDQTPGGVPFSPHATPFDPDETFGGNPRLDSGYGCYEPVIRNAMNKVLSGKGYSAKALKDVSLKTFCSKYIDNDIPVVIWATTEMVPPQPGDSWVYQGKTIQWIRPQHCLMLIGYDDNNYIFSDPGRSSYPTYYSKAVVEASYTGKLMRAVVILKSASVKSVKLNAPSKLLTVGGSCKLKARISPSNAANKKVTWKTSKKSVATVNSVGKVTAKSPGKATITVTTKDGGKKAKCTINVKPKRPPKVKASVVSAASVKISWGKVAGITGYQIRRSTSKNGTYKHIKFTKSTGFTDTGRTAGKTYYYKIRSYKNVDGKKIYSSSASVVSVKPRPLKVTGVKTVKSEPGKAEISWKKQANVGGYQIVRSTSENGTYKSVGSTGKRIFKNTQLTHGKTYYYKVRAYKTVKGKRVYGTYSAVKSVEV